MSDKLTNTWKRIQKVGAGGLSISRHAAGHALSVLQDKKTGYAAAAYGVIYGVLWLFGTIISSNGKDIELDKYEDELNIFMGFQKDSTVLKSGECFYQSGEMNITYTQRDQSAADRSLSHIAYVMTATLWDRPIAEPVTYELGQIPYFSKLDCKFLRPSVVVNADDAFSRVNEALKDVHAGAEEILKDESFDTTRLGKFVGTVADFEPKS